MNELQVVTWLWNVGSGPFTSEYVNKLYRSMRRHYHRPFVFWCITDFDTKNHQISFDNDVQTYPMSEFRAHREMKAGNRGCFHRLRLCDREMANVFGPRILQLDLDMVITDDVTPLFNRPDPLVLVEQNHHGRRVTYNPSMLLMDAGILHDMWTRFTEAPDRVWQTAKTHGWNCSDMSIINDYLDQHQTVPRATWRLDEGVLSYWREVKRNEGKLPAGARAVLFYGSQNPSDQPIQAKSPWILEHWK